LSPKRRLEKTPTEAGVSIRSDDEIDFLPTRFKTNEPYSNRNSNPFAQYIITFGTIVGGTLDPSRKRDR
jgi:hypothetical protein